MIKKLLTLIGLTALLMVSLLLFRGDTPRAEADAITNYAGRLTVDAGTAHTADWNSTAWTQEGYGSFNIQVTQDVTDAADSVVYTLYRSADPVGCAYITNWGMAYDTILVSNPAVAATRYISYVASTPQQNASRLASVSSTPVQQAQRVSIVSHTPLELANELASVFGTPLQDASRLASAYWTPVQLASRLASVTHQPVELADYISYTQSSPVVMSQYITSTSSEPVVISKYITYTTATSGTNPITTTYYYADSVLPFMATYSYGTNTTPFTVTYGYAANTDTFTDTNNYTNVTTPFTVTYTYNAITTPFTNTYSYNANTTPYTDTYSYATNTTPFTQTYSYSTVTTPFTETYNYVTVAAIAASVTRVDSAQAFTVVGDGTLNLEFSAGGAWCYRVTANSTTGRTVTTTIYAAPVDIYK